MANPLKKIERKREEPKLGEPKLVETEGAPEVVVAQELQGESVADTLVRARQQFGQDLRSIADVLCIRFAYLDAIERSQYENLPGATYAVGFVRTYAEYLGLDGDKVVERFKSEVEGLDNQTKLHFPTPAPEGKMPGGAVFLVAALLFAGAYGVWFYLSNKGESLGDLVSPVPERLQEMVGGTESPEIVGSDSAVTIAPAQTPPSQAAALPEVQAPSESMEQPVAEAPAAPQDSAALEAVPATEVAPPAVAPVAEETPVEQAPAAPMSALPATTTSEPAEAAAVPEESAATPREAAPAPLSGQVESAQPAQTLGPDQSAAIPSVAGTPEPDGSSQGEAYAIPAAPDNNTPATSFLVNHEPRVYGEESADARIVLKANQDAWVQVRDRQGTLLLTRVLRVGDSYRVPNQADLTLLTGNAGGLEISVDGRTVAPLGPVGAVRRNIPLDPEGLISGAGRQP